MRLLKKDTARDILVFMADESDHVTGKTGLTLTITASKDTAAFASITPTVTERGDGWYKLALTASHTDTAGDFALHVTGTAADPADVLCQVVADLPGSGPAGLRRGTAQGGSGSTIQLDTGASVVSDTYKHLIVSIVSGTGAGQGRIITGYNGTTKNATVEPDFVTAPSSDSVFEIVPSGIADIHAVDGDGALSGYLAALLTAYQDTSYFSQIATTVVAQGDLGADVDAILAAISGGSVEVVQVGPLSAGGLLVLYKNGDYKLSDNRAIRITLPAGTYPDITGATCRLGVTKSKDNTGGFVVDASAQSGSAVADQTIDFELDHTTETGDLEPAYAYGWSCRIVYPGVDPLTQWDNLDPISGKVKVLEDRVGNNAP